MTEEFVYTASDFQELEASLMRSESIGFGRPDQFQYYQNELTKDIATFLLRPYRKRRMEQRKKEIVDN